MKFTEKLKDVAKSFVGEGEELSEEFEIADRIRDDPKFAQPINKLRELTVQRDEILRALRNVELDIDACLVLISYKKEKEENGPTKK